MKIGLSFFSALRTKGNPFDLCLTTAEWADTNGLCTIWIPERHYHSFGGAFPDPAVAAAAIAARTKRIAIRSGSVVLPLHDPIELVEKWAMVDCMSHGRVGMAVAPGWRKEDFLLCPTSYEHRHDLMWSRIEEVRNLWRTGAIQRSKEASAPLIAFPRPVQNELSIWIALAKHSVSVQRAAAARLGIFTHLVFQTESQLAAMIRNYRNDFPQGNVTVMLHTLVAKTDDEAQSIARAPLMQYLEQWRDISAGGTLRLSTEEEKILEEVSVAKYFKHKRSLIGSVNSCRVTLQRLERIGVDEVACLIDFGVTESIVLEQLDYLKQLIE